MIEKLGSLIMESYNLERKSANYHANIIADYLDNVLEFKKRIKRS